MAPTSLSGVGFSVWRQTVPNAVRNPRVWTLLALLVVFSAGCGKDSCITDPAGPAATVEFGEGIEIITPADTVIHYFSDFPTATYQGRPAIPLKDLIGEDTVSDPDLYGYRFIGVDGFYPNQPGKGYGDNTWSQLEIGYLDLGDVKILFETEKDPTLRKGHNVKWLIRVEVLRSIDMVWQGGRILVAVRETPAVTVPSGFPGAGGTGIPLSAFMERADPSGVTPEDGLYRVTGKDGSGLPRLLTWEEMNAAYYLEETDEVVMSDALGPAYRVQLPKTIEVEASR